MRLILVAYLLALAGCDGTATSTPPPVVSTTAEEVMLTGRVVDQADIMPAPEEQALLDRLQSLEKDTTDQLVVVTVKSLEGKPIEQFAKQLGNRWGLGRADVDNGVLLLVAPIERQVRVEVGSGLEGLLTDEQAAAIIQEMLPSFREGRPVEAIGKGVSEISLVLRSDKRRPQPKIRKEAA